MEIDSLSDKDANRPYDNQENEINLDVNEIDNVNHENRNNIDHYHIEFNQFGPLLIMFIFD
jgi:hypothetical protein